MYSRNDRAFMFICLSVGGLVQWTPSQAIKHSRELLRWITRENFWHNTKTPIYILYSYPIYISQIKKVRNSFVYELLH